jgi:hypothetical protein
MMDPRMPMMAAFASMPMPAEFASMPMASYAYY